MRKKRSYSPRIARNLRACYLRATPEDIEAGKDWYWQGFDKAMELAEEYGFTKKAVHPQTGFDDVSATAGIIAALSPGSQWERNLTDAETFCQEWRGGARGRKLPALGSYGFANVVKAGRCAAGEDPLSVLGGLKVRAFYACLINPDDPDAVCLDRHAKSAAYGRKLLDRESVVSVSEYDWLAEHFRREARRAGLLPNQFQAICWVVWRRLRGILDQEDLPF